jgi:alkyl hydroperoxide reductase subunit AhpC
MSVQVGRPAPDFTATAYHEGQAREIKLSSYKGKWVMLCFYPADFTCV